MITVQLYGRTVDYEFAALMMDDELREQIHLELAPCKPQEFMDEYVKRHEEKFKEPFRL